MTEEELKQAGFWYFSWNNGAIIEYWKSLTGDPFDFDTRLGVRFGEFRDRPFTVWLFTRNSMYPLRRITTIQQLNEFYNLARQ